MGERPPLDPDSARLIEQFRNDGVEPYHHLGVLRARRALEGVTRLQGERVEVAEVRDILVPGAAGRLPARVYRPVPAAGVPLLVYFHGGGFVLGSVAAADRPCRSLAVASGCTVVSVDYRLAPETPYPGPFEDCLAAWMWLSAHAGELGCDPERVGVAGDSAGGNLAAAVALAARPGHGPGGAQAPTVQALIYPVLSPEPVASHRDNATGYLLTTAEVEWFWELYLGTAAAQQPTATAAPLSAEDVSGAPPAIVVTAGYDPLRDEGLAYAVRLRDAGVAVEALHYPSAIHGSMWMAGALPVGRAMLQDLGGALRHHLHA